MKKDGNPAISEGQGSRPIPKAAHNPVMAHRTSSPSVDPVGVDAVSLTFDQGVPATRTERPAPFPIGNVPGVDIMKPHREGPLPGVHERPGGSGGHIRHPVVGMKGRKVKRNIGAQFPDDPLAHL